MESEWQDLRFSQAVSINPPVRLRVGAIFPFVDMQAVDPSARYVYASEQRVFNGGGSRFVPGDTLMARITPCLENGKIARFNSPDGLPGHGSTEFIVIRGREGVTDSDFAYYLTRSQLVRDYAISQMTGTSGRQRVPTASLEHLTVTIPPLPTQRAIAHILGTLDDKIELNRRMNATLEAMARALFKSWFVDFDPVRAKAAGRQPAGMDAETAALFPDGFQDSALGEVPRGWMAAPYDDVIEIISGGTPKTSIAEYWGGNIPWFSVVDAPNPSDVYVIDTEKRITPAGLENSSTCVLPAGTTIISARGTVGKLALTGVAMAMNQSCYGLRGKATFGQFLTYFTTQGVVSTLLQRTHGSVFNTITRDTFKTVEVVVPSHVVARTFEQRVKPYMHRILNNLLESRTLAALRDALLPKLLSGEIRVRAKGEMA